MAINEIKAEAIDDPELNNHIDVDEDWKIKMSDGGGIL